jgi:hypothetical protein
MADRGLSLAASILLFNPPAPLCFLSLPDMSLGTEFAAIASKAVELSDCLCASDGWGINRYNWDEAQRGRNRDNSTCTVECLLIEADGPKIIIHPLRRG